ncbi:LPS assembly lipoprotein LptE [Sphingomonas morindae]|uniref:LPS assembly lipoprotein LptE n=1 Tax=Sphingomonas morindae TaxID=1541170 RepID=A0ABY4XC46_9SPHN|nr:LPS assembly lipoprotein LptE [Sphingomonas morindae]USI74291.1 LPS assembly lipoprotein LptE [Sphingomonas morindae]
MRRRAALALMLALPGCGLHPLYGGGSAGPVGQALGQVEVAPIGGGQTGWLMRAALADRLGAVAKSAPRYRLEVELDDSVIGLGINDRNAVTRERRSLRARFRLVDTEAASSVVLDATAGSDVGIDVTSSDYSTLAAEQTALENLTGEVADQIVARVALFARRTRAKE